jgi:diaminopimelate epimerase
MRLWKAHGLGNDYLVWEDPEPINSNMVIALCHRNTGVGADGILEPRQSDRADLGVRIWNPDGSIAEKSGNGLRIFAWWHCVQCDGAKQFTVDTGTDIVHCIVDKEAGWVRVEMGRALFLPSQIPTTTEIWNQPYEIADGEIFLWAVGMGNPHCVCFFDKFIELDSLPWRNWGAALEVDDRFPNRTNVQFARVLSNSRIEIRIWERGAGETLASGSSSCAVAVVARKMGWVDTHIIVEMPGGELLIDINDDFELQLQGPVVEIGRVELSRNWC